jgi:bifunctional glutamyl/prolyl-tRNA synthetase
MPKQKKQILLGLTSKKEEDFADWYNQVLTKAELIDYHDVSGCYVLRPNSYQIWEYIQQYLDRQFKKDNVRNAYFPLFITKEALEKEASHLDDFSPEVAWVTKAGNKNLDKEIAIRPTSETSMYPYFSRWLQSYRDLPIKINQWNNIVRWEFKCPTPFIRSREFLWQEGHTAHSSAKEADEQVHKSLETYRQFYKTMLSIEVIPGYKTTKEKFAGSDYTTTVEAFIPEVGRGIQAGTSHMLGQNFSKMFNIVYENPEKENQKLHVWQTSWGLTTRSIGTMIMTHADNIGMVLPPAVAFYQVVIVPTGLSKKTPDDVKQQLFDKCEEYNKYFNEMGIRCYADTRTYYSPPWKYNYWEMRGIPLRVELGPRELESGKCTFVNRVTGKKTVEDIPTMDIFQTKTLDYLKEICQLLYQKSYQKLHNSTSIANNWTELQEGIQKKHMIATPFCGKVECENNIKMQLEQLGEEYQGCKTLCVPLEQTLLHLLNKDENGLMDCVNPLCTHKCDKYTLMSKSY